MEEQAEIENVWNQIRTNEQVQKVLAYLGIRPPIVPIEASIPSQSESARFDENQEWCRAEFTEPPI